MIQDVSLYSPRSVNLEQLSLGNIGLTTEQGRLLGLRSDQTVKGIVDESGNNIILITEYANLRMAISPSLTPGFSFLFKVILTAQGAQLDVVRSSASKGTNNSLDTKKSTLSPRKFSGLINRLNYLYHLDSPITSIKVFANPVLLGKIISIIHDEFSPPQERDELLNSTESISADTIKASLLSSGLFRARKNDKKNLTLVNILEIVRENIDDISLSINDLELKDITDAIDYMESSQLLGVLRQEQQESMYRFPIFFHNSGAAEICIHRDEKEDKDKHHESQWKIDINLPLDEKSTIAINVRLSNLSVLDLYVWTEDKALKTLLESSIGILRNDLSKWDISLNTCRVILGNRPQAASLENPNHSRAGTSLDCLT